MVLHKSKQIETFCLILYLSHVDQHVGFVVTRSQDVKEVKHLDAKSN